MSSDLRCPGGLFKAVSHMTTVRSGGTATTPSTPLDRSCQHFGPLQRMLDPLITGSMPVWRQDRQGLVGRRLEQRRPTEMESEGTAARVHQAQHQASGSGHPWILRLPGPMIPAGQQGPGSPPPLFAGTLYGGLMILHARISSA